MKISKVSIQKSWNSYFMSLFKDSKIIWMKCIWKPIESNGIHMMYLQVQCSRLKDWSFTILLLFSRCDFEVVFGKQMFVLIWLQYKSHSIRIIKSRFKFFQLCVKWQYYTTRNCFLSWRHWQFVLRNLFIFCKNANIANFVLAVPLEINKTNEICNLGCFPFPFSLPADI